MQGVKNHRKIESPGREEGAGPRLPLDPRYVERRALELSFLERAEPGPKLAESPRVEASLIGGGGPRIFIRIEIAHQTSWIRRAAISGVWLDRFETMRFLDEDGEELARFHDCATLQALMAELEADPLWAEGQRADNNPDRVFLSLFGCEVAPERISQLGEVLVFRAAGNQVGLVVDEREQRRVRQLLDAAI